MSKEITITLHYPQTGASESMPLSNALPLAEVLDFSMALLGIGGGDLVLTKDGKELLPLSQTLAQAGVNNGDLLVVLSRQQPAVLAPAVASGTGLDFSNLLGGGSRSTTTPVVNDNATPFYYAGMPLHEAMSANKHPKAFIKLLQTHDHLFKELNYHSPILASKLRNQPYEAAVTIWRDELVKGSIKTATVVSNAYHQAQSMKQRLQQNPNDAEAKAYFDKQTSKQVVDEQYRHCMEEYPESMGRVLMLYIETKINNHPLQAFVDSGAQMTIMSKKCAVKCGLLHLLDDRFAGVAVGVGTGKILGKSPCEVSCTIFAGLFVNNLSNKVSIVFTGKIHIVQLQIGDYFFPCSVTIMDDATLPLAGEKSKSTGEEEKSAKPKDMDFLLGLDMLKRFNCMIDLGDGTLKFRLGSQTMSTPFLHEKDLDATKGGTKGFDADRNNQEWMAAQQMYEAEDNINKKDDQANGAMQE